jgi:hypothetical protein
MLCPSCGKSCPRPAEEVLSEISGMYMACPACPPDPRLDKARPLAELPREVRRCLSCQKAPLDGVMLDCLQILVELGLRDKGDGLRSVGSPLIVIGYPLAFPPRLGPRSLLISGEGLNREAAQEILARVPEVKGLILGRNLAGVAGAAARENLLLAGCDLRGDVVQSLFGELVIYKSQSKVHIEFPRESAPKMRILEEALLGSRAREVVDGLCGPGTLGLVSILGGVRRVVLNDIWLPAVENVMLNLEANRSLLGLEEIERLEEPQSNMGSEPVLVGRASGSCQVEVYHGDLARLFELAKPADLCLIDPFPGEDYKDLERACRVCRKVIIV